MSSSAAIIKISIEGMSCSGCSGSIIKGIQTLDGVQEVTIDLATKSGYVTCDEAIAVNVQNAVQEKIVALGFTSSIVK
jgi:copper chaperone CopZ